MVSIADSQTGRETFLMRVDWKNDWPIFNKGNKLQLRFDPDAAPRSEAVGWRDDLSDDSKTDSETVAWRDDFEGGKDLELGWYTKSIDWLSFPAGFC